TRNCNRKSRNFGSASSLFFRAHSLLDPATWRRNAPRFLTLEIGSPMRPAFFYKAPMKKSFLAATLAVFCVSASSASANGGAWQEGIPGTGSASASDKGKSTNVSIESEILKIDLHAEYAAVEVHYRMHNTGPTVEQDFFFPIERWQPENGEESVNGADLDHYQIRADEKELSWTNVSGPKDENAKINTGEIWEQSVPVIKSWKKSVIPFERDQTREITIRYGSPYSETNESVSDDAHISNAIFAYSLSPAATWKGPIGKGKIEINILHSE